VRVSLAFIACFSRSAKAWRNIDTLPDPQSIKRNRFRGPRQFRASYCKYLKNHELTLRSRAAIA
jgi:hypothetical protein